MSRITDSTNDSTSLSEEEAGQKCDVVSSKRQFETSSPLSVRTLFVLITVSALVVTLIPIVSVGSLVVWIVVLFTLAFGGRETRRAAAIVTPALYGPYLWLVADVESESWTDYRWDWIRMIGQLPGITLEMTMHPLSEIWFQIVTSIGTLAIFSLLVTLARPSRLASILTFCVTLLASLLNSALCYALYRA